MIISSRRFGKIEVDKKEFIHFPEGLIGFESIKRYFTIINPDEEPFEWMQSVDDMEASFLLINPLLVIPDYDFEVDNDTINMIEIGDPKDLKLYAIVTMTKDVSKMTANLIAPILVNTKTRKARQIVLQESPYPIRFRIFEDQEDDEKETEDTK